MSQVRVLQRPYTSASADPWETLDVGGFEQPLRRRDQLLGLDSAHQHLGNEAVEGVVVLPAHDRKLGVTPLDGLAQPLDQVNCGSPPQGRRCAWATPSPSVLRGTRRSRPRARGSVEDVQAMAHSTREAVRSILVSLQRALRRVHGPGQRARTHNEVSCALPRPHVGGLGVTI